MSEASAQKLPNSEYIKADISDEKYRQVILSGGEMFTIEEPKTLIIRKGGATHRVVTKSGKVYCYEAPEYAGRTALVWESGTNEPVQF
ncbi:MAG: hypothetical protein HN932_12855 [Candidatus Marinimicrobia bacterium]|jgi:hypothetical protein|nr:hypothetical protein [Candidatus Neomarinimicrobiota bacterium]MBT7339104.1 hypothetical protein [Candidatus Jacksonbacteria bacterium]